MEPKPKKPKLTSDQLSDCDVFITEYIDKNIAGIGGIIKARYTDFQVNEIDNEGHVVKLSSLDPYKQNVKVEENDYDLSIIAEEKLNELKDLTKDTKVDIEVTNLSKEDRTKIHDLLRNKYPKKYVSETVTKNDQKFISIKLNVKGNRSDVRSRWDYDKEYVHFVVYKEFVDTIQVTLKFGDCLRLNPGTFCYAGVKDKRAVTTQWFSCRKVDPIRLQQKINQTFKNKILIGDVCFKDSNLELGQLKGNKFRIALRNMISSNDLIERSALNLASNGFINYYGLQRFGKFKDAPSHLIGLKLLTGQWKEACELILKNKLESLDLTFDTLDSKTVYENQRNYEKKSIESILLKSLSEVNKNDYVTALEKLPRSLRLLYLHAYQSFIWNQMVSKRLIKYGRQLIIGDLVQVSHDNDGDNSNRKCNNIDIVTVENIGKYNVFDLVLPLPGFDIKYPLNDVKNWYKEVLENDGLTLEIQQQKLKKYNLSGTYRTVFEKVECFSYKILNYNDPFCDLIRTDYDELCAKEETPDVPDGKYKAVILEFNLTSSSYATMVLRELLKCDTSINAQTELNDYHLSSTSTNID